jgi:hypothetical protein
MIFSGVGAMIVSLTLGGINQVRFSHVIIRALIFGILFALISQGIVFLFRRFLPDLFPEGESRSDNQTTTDFDAQAPGRQYDYVMPGGGYDRNTAGTDEGEADDVLPAEPVISRLDDDSDEDADEAEALDDDQEQVRSDAAMPPVESRPGRRDIQLNVDDSGPSFDSLPELGDYTSTFSDKKGGKGDEEPHPSGGRLETGVTYKSRGGMHTNNDQAVEQFMSRGNEPAEMAKTISTVLKREKNST